ncbi:MAG: Sll0314/Alr1548 family TPR repeat-containing protein [Xenococcaceae cyanobacterium]
MIANHSRFRQLFFYLTFSLTVNFSFWASSALAGDPFRQVNPRNIGKNTEDAFVAIFKRGNYQEAKQYLNKAEKNEADEPLAYAMQASLAYTNKDWETVKNYAGKTLEKAKNLAAKDSLRGNLYQAIGYALEGAYVYNKEGAVSAIPKLQQIFYYFDEAEKNDAEDPELNLLKGYLDLLLATNLPFSTPEQAIERFEKFGAPNYLVDRGLAVAYRDLKQYDKAIQSVDRALKLTPENPEIFYLKGQILRKQGRETNSVPTLKQALEYFDRALEKSEQLTPDVLKTLKREQNKTREKIKELG